MLILTLLNVELFIGCLLEALMIDISGFNICCGYSSKAPHRVASYEYPQGMFSLRNKKNIYLLPSL